MLPIPLFVCWQGTECSLYCTYLVLYFSDSASLLDRVQSLQYSPTCPSWYGFWLLHPPHSSTPLPVWTPDFAIQKAYSSWKVLSGTCWKVSSFPSVWQVSILQYTAQTLPPLWGRQFSHLIKSFLFPQLLQLLQHWSHLYSLTSWTRSPAPGRQVK